jgi:membrane associated rhomboid family serine protease
VAGVAHVFIMPDATRSLVGASGAISAMLGAAAVIGWRWALPVRLWRAGRTFFTIRLPAVTAIWVTFQAVSFASAGPHLAAGSTVATWVHLAGFAFGALVAGIWRLLRVPRTDYQQQSDHIVANG